jgi:hypothetical protein
MNIGSVLFMTNNTIILPFVNEVNDMMFMILPVTICVGVFTAHLAKEPVSKVLLNLIGAIFLLAVFQYCLEAAIDTGGMVGQKFIQKNNSIFTDWVDESSRVSSSSLLEGKKFKVKGVISFEPSIFLTILSYISNKLIAWVLLVLSIINTITYTLAKATFPILLAISVIPMFYKIQKSLFLYIVYCFLLPICVGVVIGVFDVIVTDEFEQFPILAKMGFIIAFIMSLGLVGKYVYNILSGDGFAQTASAAGQNFANMASMWMVGAGINTLINRPRDLLGTSVKNLAQKGSSSGKGLLNNSTNLISRSLSNDSVSYSDIAKNGISGLQNSSSKTQRLANTIGRAAPNELKNIQQFAREKISKDMHSGSNKFSNSEYSNWKSNNTMDSKAAKGRTLNRGGLNQSENSSYSIQNKSSHYKDIGSTKPLEAMNSGKASEGSKFLGNSYFNYERSNQIGKRKNKFNIGEQQ